MKGIVNYFGKFPSKILKSSKNEDISGYTYVFDVEGAGQILMNMLYGYKYWMFDENGEIEGHEKTLLEPGLSDLEVRSLEDPDF